MKPGRIKIFPHYGRTNLTGFGLYTDTPIYKNRLNPETFLAENPNAVQIPFFGSHTLCCSIKNKYGEKVETKSP